MMAKFKLSQYVSLYKGHLICERKECVNSDWCEHLNSYISAYEDAGRWQDLIDETEDDFDLMVPIVPALGCYAECSVLVNQKNEKPVGQVWWMFTPKVGQQEEYDLGRIMPGEGIATWSAQIWETFMGLYGPEMKEKVCLYGAHTRVGRKTFNEHVGSPGGHFAEMWSIACTSRCIACQKDFLSIGKEDDLVPDIAQRGFPKYDQTLPTFFQAAAAQGRPGQAVDIVP